MTISKAYNKMLKNGSASKPIRIQQPTPDNPKGGMGGIDDSVNEALGKSKENGNWDIFDSQMQEIIEKKSKTNEKKSSSKTISDLKKRVSLLEGIVEQIMKAQMSILKNG